MHHTGIACAFNRIQPAIYLQSLASNVPRVLRAKKTHRGSNFVHGTHPAQRYPLQHRGTLVIGQRIRHIGLNETGCHRIHRYPSRSNLHRQRTREPL